MPTLAQLLKDQGVTLPDGVNLTELVESSDEVKGLKTKRDELLSWQSENKPALERFKADYERVEAEKAKALKEKEELAIKNKDYETLSQITADKLAKFEADLNASRERTKQSATDAARQSVASQFEDKVYGQFFAEKSTIVELSETGEPITKFKFGEQTFDKLDDWKSAAAKDQVCASMMKAPQSQGPNLGGQGGGDGGKGHETQTLSKTTQGYLAGLTQ